MSDYFYLFLIVLFCYLSSTFLYCLRAIFEWGKVLGLALRITIAGFLVHLIALGLHLGQGGYPYLKGGFESLQLTSFSMMAVFLILCLFPRYKTMGFIMIPVSLAFYIMSLTAEVTYLYPGHFLQNPWAVFHLLSIFVSMALFMVSLVLGLCYLACERRIKVKKLGGFLDRLPPLESIDRSYFRALYAGFIFFTVGIIMGGGWSKSTVGLYLTGDVKQTVSIAVWIFYALFLNLRVSRGWIGRPGIMWSGLGFVAVIFLLTWVER